MRNCRPRKRQDVGSYDSYSLFDVSSLRDALLKALSQAEQEGAGILGERPAPRRAFSFQIPVELPRAKASTGTPGSKATSKGKGTGSVSKPKAAAKATKRKRAGRASKPKAAAKASEPKRTRTSRAARPVKRPK